MKKKFILDTNVLMHDPAALFSFDEHDVYIPLEVIGELDKFKKGNADINVNAREVTRTIERMTRDGIPEQGVQLEYAGKPLGKLFFLLPEDQKEIGLEDRVDETYVDTVILKKAQKLNKQYPDIQTILVTKDGNLTVRTRALNLPNLKAEDYLHDKVDFDLHAFFESTRKYDVGAAVINALYNRQQEGVMVPEELSGRLEENQYLVLKSGSGSQSSLVQHRKGQLYALKEPSIGKIKPRNHSQRFLLDACLNTDLTIISALGKAGTGKTLLTLAAALHQVIHEESRKYDKIIIFRPTREVGETLGYLPGNVDEKIGPYFRAINTAVEIIMGGNMKDHVKPEQADHFMKVEEMMKKYVEKMPINYARGDTYHRCFIIVDEAQNLTKHELKVLGTRMGNGSKMVVTGDPFQIDNPYLDEKNNGLTAMTHRLKGKVPEFAYIILDKGERSREAKIFSNYF